MGRPGEVVFTIDRDEYSPEYPREAWQHYGRGFMIKDEFGLFMYEESEDVIELVEASTGSKSKT